MENSFPSHRRSGTTGEGAEPVGDVLTVLTIRVAEPHDKPGFLDQGDIDHVEGHHHESPTAESTSVGRPVRTDKSRGQQRLRE
jgi:hypothetical protein